MTEKSRKPRRERRERVTTALRRGKALELIKAGLSPRDVAAKLGVRLSTVYTYLGHPDSRAAIARTFGVSFPEPTTMRYCHPAPAAPGATVRDRALALLGVEGAT